jgi:hypothetical protein
MLFALANLILADTGSAWQSDSLCLCEKIREFLCCFAEFAEQHRFFMPLCGVAVILG